MDLESVSGKEILRKVNIYLNDTTGRVFVDGEGILWSIPPEDRYIVNNVFGYWVNFDLDTGEIVFVNMWAPLMLSKILSDGTIEIVGLVNGKEVSYDLLRPAPLPERIDMDKIRGSVKKELPVKLQLEQVNHYIEGDQKN